MTPAIPSTPKPMASTISPSTPLYTVAWWNSAIPMDRANTPEKRAPTAASLPTQSSSMNLMAGTPCASGENLARDPAIAPKMAPNASDVNAPTRLRYQNGGWSLIVTPHLSAISPSQDGMRVQDSVTMTGIRKQGRE
ncbi:hypothetical protein BD311DRAFT_765435 [Dichomitus squalens]|uniref:Uncharacterized protein n=1 Tax=Dichomitus squalens TaxID=114155 RepID=A0A4Q9MEJ3_9APHY|nr:hypothetical protein BD311DRAFT_765435 [Dichomitus squalens]